MAPTLRKRAKDSNSGPLIVNLSVTKNCPSPGPGRSVVKRQQPITHTLNSNKITKHPRGKSQIKRKSPSPQLRSPPPTRALEPPKHAFLELPLSPPKVLDGLKFQDLLDGKHAYLGPNQMKTIYRWMWHHNTRSIKGYEFDFKLLLATLGFSDPSFSPQLRNLLHLMVQRQIRYNSTRLEKSGAVVWDERGKKKVARFAEWTEGWMSKSWDGSPARPRWTQLLLDPCFGESRGWLHMRVPVSHDEEAKPRLDLEALVVEEPEIIDPRHRSSNSKPENSSKAQVKVQEPYKLTSSTFKSLCSMTSIVSRPNYSIDISQLPQYHGVQLTPNDPHHPLRPHASFKDMDQDFGEEEYEDEEYDENIEGDTMHDDTMSDGEISDSETLC